MMRVSDERLAELRERAMPGLSLFDLVADLQDARAENKKMREALEFYAYRGHYTVERLDVGHYASVLVERGDRARKALADIDAEDGGQNE